MIIGGGASGSLTAYQLLKRNPQADVTLVDPRPQPGLGLAYSTPSMRHLLNVPAGKISALPDQPNHFLDWLHAHRDPQAVAGTFAPREVFGCYIQSLLAEVPGLKARCATVTDYRPANGCAVLRLNDASEIKTDLTVVATGNFAPVMIPGVSEQAKTGRGYCHSAWAADTYTGLDPSAPVTLIGTGLTAVDAVLRLRELGHLGVITAVSRHGIAPQGHAPYTALNSPAVPAGTAATALAYLRAFRTKIRSGADWRAAVDSLRPVENTLWQKLSPKERQRFRRHLQRRWDVVRHRTAPPIAAAIQAELEAGTLVIRKGHFTAVELSPHDAVATIRTANGLERFETARVINCAGSNMNYRKVDSPLFRSLFAQGLVSSGLHGRGFRCAENGAMIDSDGHTSDALFNLGPGRQGTLFESIAIPELRSQAAQLAETLAPRLS